MCNDPDSEGGGDPPSDPSEPESEPEPLEDDDNSGIKRKGLKYKVIKQKLLEKGFKNTSHMARPKFQGKITTCLVRYREDGVRKTITPPIINGRFMYYGSLDSKLRWVRVVFMRRILSKKKQKAYTKARYGPARSIIGRLTDFKKDILAMYNAETKITSADDATLNDIHNWYKDYRKEFQERHEDVKEEFPDLRFTKNEIQQFILNRDRTDNHNPWEQMSGAKKQKLYDKLKAQNAPGLPENIDDWKMPVTYKKPRHHFRRDHSAIPKNLVDLDNKLVDLSQLKPNTTYWFNVSNPLDQNHPKPKATKGMYENGPIDYYPQDDFENDPEFLSDVMSDLDDDDEVMIEYSDGEYDVEPEQDVPTRTGGVWKIADESYWY